MLTVSNSTAIHDVSYGDRTDTGTSSITIVFENGVAKSITGSVSSWTQCVGGAKNAVYAYGSAKVTAAVWN